MGSQIETRPATMADASAIGALHTLVFGPGRFARTAYRVREGTPEVSRFCRVATVGTSTVGTSLVAALRMTEITIGGVGGALLLGPLAVHPDFAGQGHGRQLVREALDAARAAGVRIVVLVGDEPYYGRLGFARVPPGRIVLPGPADPTRILAAELETGAVRMFQGLVRASA